MLNTQKLYIESSSFKRDEKQRCNINDLSNPMVPPGAYWTKNNLRLCERRQFN